jgi:hypothetical protein
MAVPALINGINYSWQNATIVLFGIPLIGITKIMLKEKQQKDNNYGLGSRAVSRGYGRIESECSISVYWDEIARIIDASPGKNILNIAPFDIPMVLASTRVQPRKVTVRMAEFLELPFDVSEGDTKIVVDLPMVIGGIDW